MDILVESVDYPDYIEPVRISISIEVELCEVTRLVEPADSQFSALYLAFEMPLSLKIHLPLFDPEPSCGGTSNADVDYSLISELPEWLTFDLASRTLTAESDDAELIGQ